MVSRIPTNGHPSASARSTRDALRILFRHQRKMIAFFGTVVALVIVGLIFYPRTYVSDARLLVRLGKESVGLDPTATLSQTVDIEGSRETEINSELEILRSRALLQDVVEHMGPETILGTAPGGKRGWIATAFTPVTAVASWLFQTGNVGPDERAITKLEKSIKVTSPRKSNVIVIRCRARDPELAQRILETYLNAYQVWHVKSNRTSGSYEFFVQQSDLLRQQLEKATSELRDAKNEGSLVSIAGQRQNIQNQLDAIEAGMLTNGRSLAAAESKIAALQKELGDVPSHVSAEETAGLPNVAADAMRNELYKLQMREKEATSRFTDEHPNVKALRRQVAETQKILDEQEARRTQTTKKVNLVHQSVETDLMSETALAASYKAEAKSLQDQYAAIQSKIRKLNDNEFRITELARRVDLLETDYRNYTNHREQARIDSALEAGRISNVNVVQPATFVAKPASPRVRLTLLLGLIVGALGSVLVAFIAEYFDRSLKTPEQIEHELGIPVLLSVPRGFRHELLQN
ncbi:MAG: GumC family protein [Planctomycetia bacterium]|nr:GumC family protein [Planctomycetia bacterium]